MFQQILAEILKELAEDIKKDPSLATVARCVDENELHSFLRDRLFRTDARTKEFTDRIAARFISPVKLAAAEMSECEFGELIFDALEKAAKSKNSDFKLIHHYFSPERDLVVTLKKNDKEQAIFRVLTVKTS